MQSDKVRLLEILREKSVSYGDFELSSGRKSTYYVDSKVMTFDQEGISLTGKLVLEIIQNRAETASAIGGLTMGADPIAISTIIAALNKNYPLKSFSVRKTAKSHGKRKLIEGNLDPGDKVVVLDDVITTGASTIKAIEAITELGCDIIMVVALVDRREGGTEAIRKLGYDVHTIFAIEDLLDPARLEEVSASANCEKSNIFGEKRVFRNELV
jgi:orotate phosphoribosyltransferase